MSTTTTAQPNIAAPISAARPLLLPTTRRRFKWRRVPFRIWVSLAIVIIVVGLTALASVVTTADPNRTSLANRLKPPAMFGGVVRFPLGTDQLGRDVLSRMVYGGQVSLMIALVATAAGLVAGTLVGLLAGYLRGLLDQVVMYLVDVQLSLPFILLAIVAAIALGNSLGVLVFLAALSTWPVYARVCRGVVLSLRERDYVVAARAVGAGDWHIMFRHLLPNLLAPILVLAALNIGRIILLESGLSFLGIGIKAPDPTWGNMISEGRDFLTNAPWLVVIPGGVLVLLTVAVGTIGDWLRDLSDVRLNT
jgi:peptide/nickel transport system permease protein